MKNLTLRDMTQIALVAAIYVVLTAMPPLNAISYGAYQFRISEMMNFLAFYNRKYIIGVTLGCMIANAISPQSLGLIDVIVGGGSTLVFLTLGVLFFEKYCHSYLFKGLINKGFFFFSLFFAASMVTIAWELHVILKLPFLLTWFTTAVGELASLLVGAIVVDKLARYINFKQ
ncbi:QueT transporter family protein [Streptococcus macacae]|uniref:QueT transporter n=1 Tax=Streptococcus macacae NCTC 11558 TaxID=764298 RepID=G5JWK5_9STRE|nr:QueT transporter family protein [Streptococcus macacae]EHJ52982.1 QueT transporter [Streptococcus macacae NCTC 11558]